MIAIDARGHGKSEKPESTYAREDHARDVAGLIQALGLNRPAMIGHSMGSNTASTVASVYPDLVGVLVQEDPPWRDGETLGSAEARAAEWLQLATDRKKMTPEEMLRHGQEENPTWQIEEFDP